MAFLVVLMIPSLATASAVYSQSKVELDAETGKKILILGDSLSAAYKLPRESGWVHLLRQKLEKEDIQATVVNASVSGATTAAGLQILPNALAEHKPDIVLIELGGNDGLQGKPVAYITKNLERLVSMAKQSGAIVILAGMRLPPNFGARYTEPFFAQFESIAEKHEVALIPFLLAKVAGYPAMMMSDGIHPSEKGQQGVLDNVWPVLKPLLSKKSSKGLS